MTKKLCCLFALLFSFLVSSTSKAIDYASPNVSLLDPYYRDVEKLISFGLIDIYISGQKPYSRTEFSRLTAEAESHLDRLKNEEEKEVVENILKRLKKEFPSEKDFYDIRFLHQLKFSNVLTNSTPRFTTASADSIDSEINPILSYQEGRHFVKGAQSAFESQHWINISPYFNIFIEPRFQFQYPAEDVDPENKIFLQNFQAKGVYKNLSLSVGRQALIYGQGKNGGLLLSSNPRSLDMFQLSNESPFFLPWIFKYLGPNKISFFLADLGPAQNFSGAYLAGYKWSLKPWSFFELGAALMVHSGGENSPEGSFRQRFGDLFPFSQALLGGSQNDIGNKMGGLDFRLRIPQLRNSELYGEMIFDDTHSRLDTMFIQDAGYLGGIYIPRLNRQGTLDLRLEYSRTGVRFYTHGQFSSGLTENGNILGSNLGRDAQSLSLSSNWDINSLHTLAFQLDYENRSNDVYAYITDPDAHFVKTTNLPNEERYRFGTEWQYRPLENPFSLSTKLSYERVKNFNFSSGDSRNNFLGSVTLNFNFDQWFQKVSNNR
ncbi:MAG: hypothetical protein HQM15_03845 [Deltaproteobacteria bacterium]|nr:hypothetical protein [Deltaproteobacteria bacterium]